MPRYKHFLLTRFNLKVEAWKTTKNFQEVRTNEWLKERFKLFEKYCLPSVLNQSINDFTWYIFFDIDTSIFYRNKIEKLIEKYTYIKVLYIDGLKKLPYELKKHIKAQVNLKSIDYIMTTRMDNDDIIHKDFISSIQNVFQPIDKTVIDVRKGYQLSIENKKREVRDYTHPFNAFISVIENVENFNTILSRMHYEWMDTKSVIIINEELWIELVHHGNKLNSTLRLLKKKDTFLCKDFSLSIEDIKLENKYSIYISNILLSCQKYIIKVLKKNNYIESKARKIKGLFYGSQ